MKTIPKYYNIKPETYKLYHLIYLYAEHLKTDNKQQINDFWIKEIQNEINNTKKQKNER